MKNFYERAIEKARWENRLVDVAKLTALLEGVRCDKS